MLFVNRRRRPFLVFVLRRLEVIPELSLTCSHSQLVPGELRVDRGRPGDGGFMIEWDCLDLADGGAAIVMPVGEIAPPRE